MQPSRNKLLSFNYSVKNITRVYPYCTTTRRSPRQEITESIFYITRRKQHALYTYRMYMYMYMYMYVGPVCVALSAREIQNENSDFVWKNGQFLVMFVFYGFLRYHLNCCHHVIKQYINKSHTRCCWRSICCHVPCTTDSMEIDPQVKG